MSKPTKEEQELIIFKYVEQKQSIRAVAIDCKRGVDTVRAVLKANNIAIRLAGLRNLTETQKFEIIDRYNSGELPIDIAEDFNCHFETIRYLLKKYGIKLRGVEVNGKDRKYKVDESFFDSRNLSNSALYWLGMFFADGYCSDNGRNIIALGLAHRDLGHLNKFKTHLKTDYPLIFRNTDRSKTVTLVMAHKFIHDQLLFLGKKKANQSVLTVPMTKEFLRGLTDGDGSFGIYPENNRGEKISAARIEFLGGEILLDQVRIYLHETLDLPLNSIYSKQRTLYALRYGKNNAIKIIKHLYKDAPYLDRLERKYENYLAYFSGV